MKTPKNKDFAYAMTLLKILSWPVGTWPLQRYNAFSFLRFIWTDLFLLLMLIIVCMEKSLTKSTAEENLYVLMVIGCGILALSKVTYFRIHSFKLTFNFLSATKDYNDLNDEKKRAIMRRHAYMSRVMCVALIASANICSMILSAVPLPSETQENLNITSTDTIEFPIPSIHVVTLLKFPEYLYLPIFFVEYTMLLVTSAGNLGSDLLFFGIVFHLCGQAEILKMEFMKILDGNDEAKEHLHSLIKRHGHLLILSEMLNNAISSILTIQLLSSCILICACEFQFILALQDKNAVNMLRPFFTMMILMIQLFAYCYVGNYLKYQMGGIGFSSYSCNWYNLPSNTAKEIMFVILKAQNPVHLTAGKFIVVNLETFTSILKTSMSCLSVLRIMMNS